METISENKPIVDEVSKKQVYYPGFVTGLGYANGGYRLLFESKDGKYKQWLVCNEEEFQIGKIAYDHKFILACFINDPKVNGYAKVYQIFIYPQSK